LTAEQLNAPTPAPKPIVAAIRRIIDRRFGRVAK
jgi:hypothetical protein